MKNRFQLLLTLLIILLIINRCDKSQPTEPTQSTPPTAPVMIEPANGKNFTNTKPKFEWNSVSEAVQYRLQVDNNSDFSSPEIDVSTIETKFYPLSALAYDTYYWRVAAKNAEGLWSNPAQSFNFLLLTAWCIKESMPTARSHLAIGVVNNKIYAIGGYTNSNGTVGINEVYDPVTNIWTTKASMPISNHSFAIGVVDNIIYSFGGYNNQYIGQRYVPAINTWNTIASLPTSRHSFAIGVVNNKIYAIGGYRYGLSINEEYDPATYSWKTKAPMPTKRGNLAIGVVNNKIYVMGGENDTDGFLDKNEEYNPVTDTWTEKAPMVTGPSIHDWPREDSEHSIGVVNNKILVIGGYRSGDYNSEYDPVNDNWKKKEDLPTARRGAAIGVVNGKIYVIGGMNNDWKTISTNEEYDPVLDQ